LNKCSICCDIFFKNYPAMKKKSKSELDKFVKESRKKVCDHFSKKPAVIPLSNIKITENKVTSPKIVDLPKTKIVDLPKPKIVVPEPLKSNSMIGLPNSMNAKDYHDFLMGR